jgi:hypothetical protein
MDSIHHELAALREMSVAVLRFRYTELFGIPAKTTNRYFLLSRIAWRMQANLLGDISEEARARAEELASKCTLKGEALFARPHPVKNKRTRRKRLDKRLPTKATLLTRIYKNREITVSVLTDGFEYGGQCYRSLSAIARVVTGTQWNGLVFFGLAKRGEPVKRKGRRPRMENANAA